MLILQQKINYTCARLLGSCVYLAAAALHVEALVADTADPPAKTAIFGGRQIAFLLHSTASQARSAPKIHTRVRRLLCNRSQPCTSLTDQSLHGDVGMQNGRYCGFPDRCSAEPPKRNIETSWGNIITFSRYLIFAAFRIPRKTHKHPQADVSCPYSRFLVVPPIPFLPRTTNNI